MYIQITITITGISFDTYYKVTDDQYNKIKLWYADLDTFMLFDKVLCKKNVKITRITKNIDILDSFISLFDMCDISYHIDGLCDILSNNSKDVEYYSSEEELNVETDTKSSIIKEYNTFSNNKQKLNGNKLNKMINSINLNNDPIIRKIKLEVDSLMTYKDHHQNLSDT